MIVRRATPGRWLDCVTPLTDAVLAAVAAATPKVVGIIRSAPLPRNNTSGEVTAAELARILDHGFESMWYQRVRGTPATDMLWTPSQHDGQEDAACAAKWAHDAGYPDGMHGWQDLEATSDTAVGVLGYCMAWGRTLIGAGFRVGLYVGYSPGLTPEQLYSLPAPESYWHGGGGPTVATRGYAIRQGASVTIAGVKFDENLVAPDAVGDLPYCVAAT